MKLIQGDNKYRTQDKAIAYHNAKKQKMLSFADVYKIAKARDEGSIEILRKSLKDYLMTSTRIFYDEDNLSATIIHNYGSEYVKEKRIKVKIVNYLSGDDYDEGDTKFFQAMCKTKDSFDEIKKNLQYLSGGNTIYWWTTSPKNRGDEKGQRAVRLFFYWGRFGVDGNGWVDDDGGCSHGVSSDSEPKARSKIKPTKKELKIVREAKKIIKKYGLE